MVELPFADCCPCVEKLRTMLPIIVGIRDSAVQLVSILVARQHEQSPHHYVGTACGCLVDSSTCVRRMLYDVLGSTHVQKGRVPVLVACNKMDLSSAHSVEFCRKRLEKEM